MKRKSPKPTPSGMFDQQFRMQELTRSGDVLLKLDQTVRWEMFRTTLEKVRDKERKSNAGRPPFDVVLMFKVLVLQSLYNLSDDAAEYQIRDRLSFMRFLGLELCDRVPDAKTIWLFREQLQEAGLIEELFEAFDIYLTELGYAARKGQIIDASIVPAPRQRNTREENETIKAGETPEQWQEQPAKLAQKDVDARWTQKNGKNYYGYKNHICIDAKFKLIRLWAVTHAALHDSQMLDAVLDEKNSCREVWADSAYRSAEILETLNNWKMREHIQRKGNRGGPLSAREQQGNRTRSRIRSRIEHVFGAQLARARVTLVRTIGLVRARCKIGLRNLAYNLDRFRYLAQARG